MASTPGHRRYTITRASFAGSRKPDLCAPLKFSPPQGSVELVRALQETYPNIDTHSNRMRQAIIDFHTEEQETERLSHQPQDAISWYSETSSSSHPNPPPLRDLTKVWNVTDGAQAIIRTRRTMTENEREQYRQRRKLGACPDCKRRRRKVRLIHR